MLALFSYGIAILVIVIGVVAVLAFMAFMRLRAVRVARRLGGDKHCVFCGEPLPTHRFHIQPVCARCGRAQPWAHRQRERTEDSGTKPV
jgi:hypothetical protein